MHIKAWSVSFNLIRRCCCSEVDACGCPLKQTCLIRLVEAADLAAAQDLFGSSIDLDAMQPKSAKDFEDFAAALAQKHFAPHAKSANYKTLVKAVSLFSLDTWAFSWTGVHAALCLSLPRVLSSF